DQIYTNIYNLAIKLSKRVTLSEIKATYGYKNEDNPGLYFYPAVQSAHVLFPQEKFGIKNVLVPIGPDEDAHIRISRDIARRSGYHLPSILHAFFFPGIDGEKMSKSRNNAIFFRDSAEEIRKKVNKAFSGGRDTEEEQRKYGANPEKDVSIFYLTKLFLSEKESEKITNDYKSGKILTKDVKQMLADELIKFIRGFQEKLRKITIKDLEKSILKNEK
ncbi:MAG: tryptophan--tRNA ligase, partial [Nanoarchaeota archaeon]